MVWITIHGLTPAAGCFSASGSRDFVITMRWQGSFARS